jgi:hypothetical protein
MTLYVSIVALVLVIIVLGAFLLYKARRK